MAWALMESRLMEPEPQRYVYRWGPRGPDIGALRCLSRKGDACRVLCRGAMNSVLVEFNDGSRAVVSRNALRKARVQAAC
jgi:hypothetical protein